MPWIDRSLLRNNKNEPVPQHWGGSDWEVSGVDNPLPVANYTQTGNGIWLPVSKDNPVPTQVTGSNVEIIKKHEDTHMVDYDKGNIQYMYFGNNEINAPSPLEALDISEFSNISIYLENNYNNVLGSIYVYGMKEKDSIGRDGNLIYSFKVDNLEEGESIY